MTSFKILLVLFSVLQLGFSSCPYGCSCEDRQLLCIDKKLERVPNLAILDDAPQTIDLSGNKLTYISSEDFSFEKNDAIQEIYLNNSEIVDIEKGAFEEIENLQELYLSQNLLNSVSEFIIEPLDSMVVLDLSNNHFNGDMPIIRSKSLEVLAMANSKISNIPNDAFKYLPNLKLLLLQQNNIKTISLKVFEPFRENAVFVKLSHNPMECSCANLDLFQMLQSKKLIEVTEPYQCTLNNGTFVDVFGKNGALKGDTSHCEQSIMKKNLVKKELNSEISDFKEVRNMVNQEKTSERDHLLRILEDDSLDTPTNTTCEDFSSLFLIKLKPNNRFFFVLLMSTILSFFIGLLTGVLLLKVLFANRYQQLAQDTESTSKLVFTS